MPLFSELKMANAKDKLFAFIVGSLLSLSHAAAAENVYSFEIGPWSGAVYNDDETKKFSYCLGSADYKNGSSLDIFVNSSLGWGIGARNDDWNFKDKKFPLKFRFNNGRWRSIDAERIGGDQLVIFMPYDEGPRADFMDSRVMQLSFLGYNYYFDLTGTRNLMNGLMRCAEARLAMDKEERPANETVASKPNEAVKPRESSGTGFIISTDGHVLTNNHVVEGCTELSATMTADTPRRAMVLRLDKTNDLAVIKMDGTVPETRVAKLRSETLRAGEFIAVYGYPLSGVLSASGNIVSGNITSLAGLEDDVRHFQISAPIQPGNSGGPLLDMRGTVVGVVNSKLNEIAMIEQIGTLAQNVNFAIKSSVAISFLEAHSIPFRRTSGQDAAVMDLASVSDEAKRFTVQVRCMAN